MTDVPADQGNKPAAVAPSQEPPNQEPDKSDDKSTAAIAVPASAPLVTPPPQPAKTFFEGSPPPLGSSTAKHAYTRDFLLSFRSRFTKPPANWDSDSFRELHESSFFDRDRGGGVLHNGGLGPNKPLQMFAPGATGKGDTGWRTGAGGFRPPMQALPAQIGPIRSRLVEDGTLGSSPGPQASSLPDRPVPRGPGEAGDKGWGARDRWRPNGNAEPVSPRRAARVPGEPERWHSGKLEGEGWRPSGPGQGPAHPPGHPPGHPHPTARVPPGPGGPRGPPPGMPIRPAWDPKGAVPKDGKDREPGWQKRETTPHKVPANGTDKADLDGDWRAAKGKGPPAAATREWADGPKHMGRAGPGQGHAAHAGGGGHGRRGDHEGQWDDEPATGADAMARMAQDFEAERQRMKEQSRQAGHTDKSAAQELAAVLEEVNLDELAHEESEREPTDERRTAGAAAVTSSQPSSTAPPKPADAGAFSVDSLFADSGNDLDLSAIMSMGTAEALAGEGPERESGPDRPPGLLTGAPLGQNKAAADAAERSRFSSWFQLETSPGPAAPQAGQSGQPASQPAPAKPQKFSFEALAKASQQAGAAPKLPPMPKLPGQFRTLEEIEQAAVGNRQPPSVGQQQAEPQQPSASMMHLFVNAQAAQAQAQGAPAQSPNQAGAGPGQLSQLLAQAQAHAGAQQPQQAQQAQQRQQGGLSQLFSAAQGAQSATPSSTAPNQPLGPLTGSSQAGAAEEEANPLLALLQRSGSATGGAFAASRNQAPAQQAQQQQAQQPASTPFANFPPVDDGLEGLLSTLGTHRSQQGLDSAGVIRAQQAQQQQQQQQQFGGSRQMGSSGQVAPADAAFAQLLAQKLAQQQQQQQQAPPDPYAAFAGRQPGMGGGANGLAHPSLQQQQQFRQPQASLGYGGGPLAYPQAGYAGLAGPPANAGYQNPALGQYGVRPQPALSMQSQGSALDNFFDAPRMHQPQTNPYQQQHHLQQHQQYALQHQQQQQQLGYGLQPTLGFNQPRQVPGLQGQPGMHSIPGLPQNLQGGIPGMGQPQYGIRGMPAQHAQHAQHAQQLPGYGQVPGMSGGLDRFFKMNALSAAGLPAMPPQGGQHATLEELERQLNIRR